MGTYIQPGGARHFNVDMYSEVTKVVIDCHEKGITQFIAGGFDARPVDLLSALFSDVIWNYEPTSRPQCIIQ